MQLLRLTEHFALEIGEQIAWPLVGNGADVQAVDIHVINTDAGKQILNGDAAADVSTNNVREISAYHKNITYQVPLRPTPQSYVNALYADYDASTKFNAITADSALYNRCRLLAVSGFVWPTATAGVWLRMSIKVGAQRIILCNLSLFKDQSQWTFKPLATKTRVIDNELFASAVRFDILDMQYIASVVDSPQTATITALRAFILGSTDNVQISSNIDIEIGFIYNSMLYTFDETLYGGSQLYTFNEFALREVKEVPVINADENSVLYARAEYVMGVGFANPYLQLSMNHRTMQLESFIAQQGDIDAASIVYDILTQAFNADGELIEEARTHYTIQNSANLLAPLKYVPQIDDSEIAATKPNIIIVYVTAVLSMQSSLGDIRVSRSTQLILDDSQISAMCWYKQPQLQFNTQSIVHKVNVEKISVTQAAAVNDRILTVTKTKYVHMKSIIVNDKFVADAARIDLHCAKNSVLNISIQLLNGTDEQVDMTSLNGSTARSDKGVIVDALTWSANLLSFALPNNEGDSTGWNVLAPDGTQITKIVLTK